jgi:serine/threonine-protein kinase
VSEVFQPEQVVNGRYRVLRKLGSGGMADVYLCEDLTLGRRVAIKVLLQRLLDDPAFVERFRREAKAAASLSHAHLVGIHDWGELDGTYYIVMEYVEGETLKDKIRREERLGGAETVRIGLQLLAAVEYAHRNRVIHRDIKPQNVMLDRDGNVKVMDFGIARAGDSGMTEAGSILGTAQYLAPEQAKGQPVDERSDLYSVGIVLYEMLTGAVPFKGDTAVTVALKHVNEVPREPAQVVPGLPYALNQIVLKAVAKDPADRYQNAAEFARDLRSAQVGGPLAAATFDTEAERTRVMAAPAAQTVVMGPAPLDEVTSARRPPRKRSRKPWLLVALLALVIAAAAFGLWYLMSGERAEVPSVVGQSQAAAVRTLEQAGFEVNIEEEYSGEFAAGFVSRQSPAAGTEARDGSTVDIWVSQGPETVTLSDFRGWTPQQVKDWLAANDLEGERRSGRNAAVDEGRVFRQDPPAGAEVKRGDTVTYWVSSGKPQATVPDLTGMTEAAAQAALSDEGLRLGSVFPEASETVPTGAVIRQDPPAGAKVDRDTAVSITVSSGSPSPSPSPSVVRVEVPNVHGMDASAAAETLSDAGLVAEFRERGGTGQPPGTVVDTRPAVGTLVAEGSTVILVIAR